EHSGQQWYVWSQPVHDGNDTGRGTADDKADQGCEQHRPARDTAIDGGQDPGRKNAQRAEGEADRVHHNTVTRPARHHKTWSARCATAVFRRPIRSRNTTPEAVPGTMPAPTSLLTAMTSRGLDAHASASPVIRRSTSPTRPGSDQTSQASIVRVSHSV